MVLLLSLHDIIWTIPATVLILSVIACPSFNSKISGWTILVVWSTDLWVYMFVVSLVAVSRAILWWSMYYMGSSSDATLLHLNMLWFVGSIVVLLVIGSLLVGLIGWEGLGISSFYLVAFSRSRSSIAGAIITIITNRLGDICYFVALGLGLLGVGALPVLVVLVVAASTKRSQYPFRSWLPAAMAAPTPVSRLVHSRTLVTAGIYLLIRMGLRGFSVLGVLGAVTMVGGGVVAWLGQDAKKIVALSTLSQLGLMVFSLSSCREVITFNHLITHAYFKSLLFMCVGVLIHRCYGSQESRFSSDRVSPRASVLIGGTAALRMRGLVATTGARSKHMIMCGLEPAGALVSLMLFVVGAAMTTLYSAKLIRSLGGYRVRVSTVGSSSVGGSGVSPLVFSALRGMIFYSVSGHTIGTCGIHIPTSSFFFFFVLFFLVVGSLVSVRMRRALWPGLSSAAGSLRFVGYEPKSAPIADIQSSAAISGWMGARSVLTALVYLTALLI